MDKYIRFNRHLVRPYILPVLIWLFPIDGLFVLPQLLLLSPLIVPIISSVAYLFTDSRSFNIASIVFQSILRLAMVIMTILKVSGLLKFETIISDCRPRSIESIVTFSVLLGLLVIYDTVILNIELYRERIDEAESLLED